MVLAGQTIYADDITPAGLPDLQTGIVTAGPTSGATELTILTSSSVTLDGSTRIRVTFDSGNTHPTNTADVFVFRIRDNGVEMRQYRFNPVLASAERGIHFEWISDTAPSSGAHVFTSTVQRASGAGVLSVDASAAVMYQMSVTNYL